MWKYKKNKSFLKSVASCVAVSFLFTTLSAPFVEASFWEQRRKSVEAMEKQNAPIALASTAGLESLNHMQAPSSFTSFESHSPYLAHHSLKDSINLPLELVSKIEQYGQIERVHFAAGSRLGMESGRIKASGSLVLQIQDAHDVYSVQKNIARLIRDLMEMGVEIVGVEGSEGGLEGIEKWRKYPDRESLMGVSGYLMKQGLLTGVEIAGLGRKKDSVEFYGVEEKGVYLEQVKSFKESLSRSSEVDQWYRELGKKLGQSKAQTYSVQMLELNNRERDYETKGIPLGEWVTYLASAKGLSDFHNMERYLKAYRLEKSLDFKRVELEQKSLVGALSRKMNRSQMMELLEESLAYRLGRMGAGEFYERLKERCHAKGILISPSMSRYLEYVSGVETIQREDLFREIKQCKENIWGALLKTHPKIKEIYEADKAAVLLGKAIQFKLNGEDWEEFKNESRDWNKISRALPMSDEVKKLLEDVRIFNELSLQRNGIFVEKLTRRMNEKKLKIGVLIAGGYHSEGVERELKKKNISIITIRPRIEMREINQNYNPLNSFKRSPIPLEKMFVPEKVSLARAQALGSRVAFGMEKTEEMGVENTFNALLPVVSLSHGKNILGISGVKYFGDAVRAIVGKIVVYVSFNKESLKMNVREKGALLGELDYLDYAPKRTTPETFAMAPVLSGFSFGPALLNFAAHYLHEFGHATVSKEFSELKGKDFNPLTYFKPWQLGLSLLGFGIASKEAEELRVDSSKPWPLLAGPLYAALGGAFIFVSVMKSIPQGHFLYSYLFYGSLFIIASALLNLVPFRIGKFVSDGYHLFSNSKLLKWYKRYSPYPGDIALFGVFVSLSAFSTEFFLQRAFSIHSILVEILIYFVSLSVYGRWVISEFYTELSVKAVRKHALASRQTHFTSMVFITIALTVYSLIMALFSPTRENPFWIAIHLQVLTLLSFFYPLLLFTTHQWEYIRTFGEIRDVFSRAQNRKLNETIQSLETERKIKIGSNQYGLDVVESKAKDGSYSWKIEAFGLDPISFRFTPSTVETLKSARTQVARLIHAVIDRIVEDENFEALLDRLRGVAEKYRGLDLDEAILSVSSIQLRSSELEEAGEFIINIKNLARDRTIHTQNELNWKLEESVNRIESMELKSKILRMPHFKYNSFPDRDFGAPKKEEFSPEKAVREGEYLDHARQSLLELAENLEELVKTPFEVGVLQVSQKSAVQLEKTGRLLKVDTLEGQVQSGLDPVGMLGLKEVRGRIKAIAVDLNVDFNEVVNNFIYLSKRGALEWGVVSKPSLQLWLFLSSLSKAGLLRALDQSQFVEELIKLRKSLDDILSLGSSKQTQKIVEEAAILEYDKLQEQALERNLRLLAFEGKPMESEGLKQTIEGALLRMEGAKDRNSQWHGLRSILRALALLKGLNETGRGISNSEDSYVKQVLERLFGTVELIPVENDLLTARLEATPSSVVKKGQFKKAKALIDPKECDKLIVDRSEKLFAEWVGWGIWANKMAQETPVEVKQLEEAVKVYDLSSLFKNDADSQKEAKNVLEALTREVNRESQDSRVALVADKSYDLISKLKENLDEKVLRKLCQGSLEGKPAKVLNTIADTDSKKIRVEDLYGELEKTGCGGMKVQIFTGSSNRWEESSDAKLKVEIYEFISSALVKLHVNLKSITEEMIRAKVLKIQA